MATGVVELVGSQIGSSGSNGGSGNTIAKLIDGDNTSFYDAANASGDWAGVDAGTAVTVRRVKFQPRRGDITAATVTQFEDRVFGAKVQASSSSTFSSDVNDCLTFASSGPPSYQSYIWNDIALTSTFSKQYVRWLGPTNGRCNLAELRFIADAGPSSAKPVQPVISPWGGRYPTGFTTVTITSGTTSASIYYTTDGTTPTNASTLYSAPFTLTPGVGNATTLKAVAYDASLGTVYSDVSTAFFKGYGYKPNEDWYDDHGNLLQFHSGGFLRGARGIPLAVNGYYWLYGNNANRYNVVQGFSDGNGVDGIWLYKTTDCLNFILVGNILNTAASTYFLRPHVLYNAANNNYVLWVRTYPAELSAIATASAPDGPWTWQNTAYNPGSGLDDFTLFQDDDGSAYLLGDTSTNTSVFIQKLAADYQSVTGSATTVLTGGGKEGVVMWRDHEGKYVLLYTHNSYYDSTLAFYHTDVFPWFSASPLSGWVAGSGAVVTSALVGGNYNAQGMDCLVFKNGVLLLGDYWVKSDIYQSRYVAMPIDSTIQQPISWDTSRFQTPTNSLLQNLTVFYSCSEINATDNLMDKVAGNTLTQSGAMNVYDVRLRSRDFSTNAASHASTSTFQVQASAWWNIWCYPTTVSGVFSMLFSKWNAAAANEYIAYIDTAGKPNLILSADGSSNSVTVIGGSALTANAWMMLTFWIDATLQRAGLCVNANLAGAAESSYSAGVFASSTAFWLGREGNNTNNFQGRMRDFGMWKDVKPSQASLSALYNNGLGMPYEYFTTASSSTGHFPTVFASVIR